MNPTAAETENGIRRSHRASTPPSERSTVSLGQIRQILSDLVRNEFAATVANSADIIPREIVIQYVVGAFMAVMT